jgi:SAM-dependent methyltransferase
MAAYDEVADAYHEFFDGDGIGMRDLVLDELLGDVRNERILVAACGQGRDARMLADGGAMVVGVEISERMLSYARQFEHAEPRGIQYLQGDAQDLAGVADHDFAGVVCHMALMDIPALAPTLESFARALRPGGFLVLSIVHPCFAPHVAAISDYLTEEQYDKIDGPDWLPRHAYHRPLSSYVNTLASAGFVITRMVEPRDSASDGVSNLLYLRCTLRTA